MSEFDRGEIRRIAALAHLALSEAEEEQLAHQLGGILDFVKSLSTLATEGVEPSADTTLANPHLREDVLRPSLAPEVAVRNAPSTVGTAIAVPKILE
jgi:aspartyl-tRNA(Asn)/glutamyl-tRNA(Gln) amidotransferase subunit C